MINTLYGMKNDHRDIAKKIIRETLDEPFVKLNRVFDEYFFYKNLLLSFEDLNGNKVSLGHPGLYVIYRKVGYKLECLYVGQTGYSIHNRIRRFIQALEGTLRDDESHPGGEKAKEDGVKSTDELYVKTFSLNDIRNLDEDFYDTFGYEKLDEYLAVFLRSKYNTRKAY